jgi:uncharacterized tellurite resistance protein B-like protein
MSIFHRLFGGPAAPPVPDPANPPANEPTPDTDTAAVRRIVAKLEALPPEEARLIACSAYVVTRAANADMQISEAETAFLETALREHTDLDEAQAVLVVEMAKMQSRAIGGTEDYLVTREFAEMATPEQRLAVLRTCFAVAAVDDSINAAESATINEIANELQVDESDLIALRAEFAEKFSAIQAARKATAPTEVPSA